MSIPWKRSWNVAFCTFSVCWKGPPKVTRIPSVKYCVAGGGLGLLLASFSKTHPRVKFQVTLDALDAVVLVFRLTWLFWLVGWRSRNVVLVTLKVAVCAVAPS